MTSRFARPVIVKASALALLLALAPAASLAVENAPAGPAEYAAEQALQDGHKEKDLLSSIARRQKELDEREAALRDEEERLAAVRKDIEQRIGELNAIHGRIEAFVNTINEASDERVKKVAKIYASMNPEEAASRMEKLDEKTAVMILATINEKQAAKILAFVNVEKSVKLSQSLKINKAAMGR